MWLNLLTFYIVDIKSRFIKFSNSLELWSETEEIKYIINKFKGETLDYPWILIIVICYK